MTWLRGGSGRRGTGTPWSFLHSEYPAAASTLDQLLAHRALSDVDVARIGRLLTHAQADPARISAAAAEVMTAGAAAGLHRSAQHDLPGERLAQHNLEYGQVRLGRVVPTAAGGFGATRDFGIDRDVLRTSLLVVGPPGSGKTRSFGLPVVEHLVLTALTNQASVLVVDPKGDDFAYAGWFDVTLDPLAPTAGLSLYGGSPAPEVAADRLASALLPPTTSDDVAYFMDASRNALYACLAPFRLAFDRWPTVRELLALLRVEQGTVDKVRAALKGRDSGESRRLLASRAAQRDARLDPAASMIERLGLLDRPRLVQLLDHQQPRFEMAQLNSPVRVRVALPESEYPDASRILARLLVSQFVQLTSAANTNRSIFKGLVIDEAGRFVDDYVARGVQKLRSNNAGLVLIAQTLSDFPGHVRGTVLGSVGCKAVFGGVDPADAAVFSRWFGDHWVDEVTHGQQRSYSHSESRQGEQEGYRLGDSVSTRRVERPRWSVSEIVSGLPAGHCVVALSRSTGERSPPFLVDLRG
ncbi:TraM recognition domain-containing protein [Natronosporangium hydrolyticum]|uniref:TraM recognition domain-containing protein n=1 Tax=Natronosporangium hydrolyticum TaxID=2811111 RepID=A0A895YNC3_9ACTN|nr:TraM recognition domain-containing protein [Natronosporangium hydrolyticum]QSB15428.1 TraM recognition domain-containing protein [Natronosporangium hydrolyticum]